MDRCAVVHPGAGRLQQQRPFRCSRAARYTRESDARGAHAGVDNGWITWVFAFEAFKAQDDVVAIEHTLAAADRAASGHDTGRAGIFDP